MNFIDYHLSVNKLNIKFNNVLNMLRVTDDSPDNPVVYESIHIYNQLENIADIRGGYIVQMHKQHHGHSFRNLFQKLHEHAV